MPGAKLQNMHSKCETTAWNRRGSSPPHSCISTFALVAKVFVFLFCAPRLCIAREIELTPALSLGKRNPFHSIKIMKLISFFTLSSTSVPTLSTAPASHSCMTSPFSCAESRLCQTLTKHHHAYNALTVNTQGRTLSKFLNSRKVRHSKFEDDKTEKYLHLI